MSRPIILRRFCNLWVVCLCWSQRFDTSDNSGESGGSRVNCGIFAGFWGTDSPHSPTCHVVNYDI
nr:MAG TPA: hypothetical protein [Caudoviricetes sp.]